MSWNAAVLSRYLFFFKCNEMTIEKFVACHIFLRDLFRTFVWSKTIKKSVLDFQCGTFLRKRPMFFFFQFCSCRKIIVTFTLWTHFLLAVHNLLLWTCLTCVSSRNIIEGEQDPLVYASSHWESGVKWSQKLLLWRQSLGTEWKRFPRLIKIKGRKLC